MGGTMGPPVMRAIPQPTGGSSARGGACGRKRGPPPRGCTAPQPTAAKPILESIFLGPQTIDGPPAMTRVFHGAERREVDHGPVVDLDEAPQIVTVVDADCDSPQRLTLHDLTDQHPKDALGCNFALATRTPPIHVLKKLVQISVDQINDLRVRLENPRDSLVPLEVLLGDAQF